MKVTVRTKEGKVIQVEKYIAQKMVNSKEATYVDPHTPQKAPQGYQIK
jgi:hypothetical protein